MLRSLQITRGIYSKTITNWMNKDHCIFPKAITPLQKFICGTVGVSAFGVGVYGTGSIISTCIKTQLNKSIVEPMIVPEAMIVPEHIIEPLKSMLQSVPLNVINGVELFINTTLSGLFASYVLFFKRKLVQNNIDFYRTVKGTDKCCSIVRMSFKRSGLTLVYCTSIGICTMCCISSVYSIYYTLNKLYKRNT